MNDQPNTTEVPAPTPQPSSASETDLKVMSNIKAGSSTGDDGFIAIDRGVGNSSDLEIEKMS